MIVLDTNIVLDLFVFNDPASQTLKQALQGGQVRWLATQAMRDELERVLTYPQIVPHLASCQLTAADVLAQFDRLAQLEPEAPRVSLQCSDADDQKFIDLALAHKALLLSKDRAILGLKKRLATMGVGVATQCEGIPAGAMTQGTSANGMH
jgi:putative PIN family toxin of toxin-antitoxin system